MDFLDVSIQISFSVFLKFILQEKRLHIRTKMTLDDSNVIHTI